MKHALLSSAVILAAVALTPEVSRMREMPAAPSIDLDDPLSVARGLCAATGQGSLATRQAFFLRAAAAYAKEAGLEAGSPAALQGLGNSDLEITTSSEQARQDFLRGLRWMDAFNHTEAILSFQRAQQADPACAMCVWGEALALGPNINAPMDPVSNPRAYEAAQQAMTLAASASPVEQALARALTARYAAGTPADRSALDAAWAEAMIAVAGQYPGNDQIQTLAAEAVMDAQPWDYWEADGITPKGRAADALARIERVLARNPDHVPAIHLYIHLTEASANPWRAEAAAERLATLAPAAGHLVHMPSHVYYRVGRFKDSIESNIAAVAADEAFLQAAGETAGPIYRYGYYPHNLHFVLTSAQMAGDEATAADFAARLDGSLPMEMVAAVPFIMPIKAAPLYASAQFGDPQRVLNIPRPEGGYPLLDAAWRYAQGEALAKMGRREEALAEADAIAQLAGEGDYTALVDGGVPAPDIVRVMAETVRGRAAMEAQDYKTAASHFEKAATLQDALKYTEPPYWYYPARQSFAAALLLDGQAARAEQEFYRTLVKNPDNAWAYWGLAAAREAQGDTDGAELARKQASRGWLGDAEGPDLKRL